MMVVGVLAAIALCGLALPVAAAPSLEGFTGLLLTPTADALNQDDYNLAVFARNVEEGGDFQVFAGNIGVAKGMEAGFARIKPEHTSGETILNAKYRFRDEDAGRPALAVGVIDATDEIETSTYFVLSKSLARMPLVRGNELTSPRVSVGFGGGRLSGLFGGVSAVLGEKLMLIAEYDTKDVNLGAQLPLSYGLRAHAGWTNGLNDFAAGLSFNKAF